MKNRIKSKRNINLFAILVGFFTLFILVGFPIFTNWIMFEKTPKIFGKLAPDGISENYIWIGFFATFFGATIGGIISGLFTYLGVNKTILVQEIKDANEFNEKYRAILEIHEIKGGYLLKNHKGKNGRFILTDQYEYIISNGLVNGNYNYISLRNSGPGKALNCKVKATITYEQSREEFTTEVFLPVIYEGEDIYIPFDRFIDESSNEVDENNLFRLSRVLVTYETSAKENIRIERFINNEQGRLKTTDYYTVKGVNDNGFTPIFEIKGTDDSWYYLKDLE
jgi:hypothetical protein